MCKQCYIALLAVLFFPLCAESLRNQNKMYFDSMQWEELHDFTITPIPEAYTIENSTPIPYADTIDDGDLLPVLPQLGILDYQNISEDILQFLDDVSSGFIKKSFDNTFFVTYKPFLPHLTKFMLERLPPVLHVFYGRPSFQQDGSASVQFRLTIMPSNSDQSIAETDSLAGEITEEQAESSKVNLDQSSDTNNKDRSESLPLFADGQLPLFIIMELTAVQEETAWKISHIDMKGVGYEGSTQAD